MANVIVKLKLVFIGDIRIFRVGGNLTILKGISVAKAFIWVKLTLKYGGIGSKRDLIPQ